MLLYRAVFACLHIIYIIYRLAFNRLINSTAVLFICCRFFCNIINIISLIVNNFIRAFFRYFIGIALYISLIVSNSAVYIYINSSSINAKAAVKRNINIPCVNLLNSLRRFLQSKAAAKRLRFFFNKFFLII